MRCKKIIRHWIGLTWIGLLPMANASDVYLVCNQDPVSCLSAAELQQARLSDTSLLWWRFEEQRLDALFDLQRIDELYASLRPWVDNPSVPAKYKPIVTLYLGKWLNANERRAEGLIELEKSLAGFQAQYKATPSPQLGIRILNLLVSVDKFDEAELFSSSFESANYDAPLSYREMFAELGHVAYRKKDHERHIKYRLKSLEWAKRVPDLQQQAIAFNNYAVSLRENKNYTMAEQAFHDGLTCAEQANDKAQVNNIRLRLAEVALLQGKLQKARERLKYVSLNELPVVQIPNYRRISDEIYSRE